MDLVSLIISFGATVNQRCGRGWTALHEAVSRNNTDICEILLRAGATVNPPNTYSITPLTVAAQQGWLKVLYYLIGKGRLHCFYIHQMQCFYFSDPNQYCFIKFFSLLYKGLKE